MHRIGDVGLKIRIIYERVSACTVSICQGRIQDLEQGGAKGMVVVVCPLF